MKRPPKQTTAKWTKAWDGTCPPTYPGKTFQEVVDTIFEEILWQLAAEFDADGSPVPERKRLIACKMLHDLRKRTSKRRWQPIRSAPRVLN